MMPLSMVRQGTTVRLIEIQGGIAMRRRLANLGLTCGQDFQTISEAPNGPMILKVKDSRLAIGRGVLHHILVEPMETISPNITTPMEKKTYE